MDMSGSLFFLFIPRITFFLDLAYDLLSWTRFLVTWLMLSTCCSIHGAIWTSTVCLESVCSRTRRSGGAHARSDFHAEMK